MSTSLLSKSLDSWDDQTTDLHTEHSLLLRLGPLGTDNATPEGIGLSHTPPIWHTRNHQNMNHTWAIAQDTASRASLVRPGHRSLPSAQLAMTQPQATSHATACSAEQTVMLIPAPAEATPFRTGSSLSSYLARHRTIFAGDMILATPQNWDSVSLLDSVSLVAQDNEREIQFNLRPLPYPLQ